MGIPETCVGVETGFDYDSLRSKTDHLHSSRRVGPKTSKKGEVQMGKKRGGWTTCQRTWRRPGGRMVVRRENAASSNN
jgi:hypothetical protein